MNRGPQPVRCQWPGCGRWLTNPHSIRARIGPTHRPRTPRQRRSRRPGWQQTTIDDYLEPEPQ